jgi:hypothetical protein
MAMGPVPAEPRDRGPGSREVDREAGDQRRLRRSAGTVASSPIATSASIVGIHVAAASAAGGVVVDVGGTVTVG